MTEINKMNNLVKLIIKNFFSITLSILLTGISAYALFKVLALVAIKFFPCEQIRGDIFFLPPPSQPLSLGCKIQMADATIPSLLGLITLLIIWYLLLRKLLGKFMD